MKKGLLAALLILIALTACSRKPSDGFRPPIAEDPLAAFLENWHSVRLVSGAYEAEYTFSDGGSQGVRADMLVQPDRRSVVNLTYQTRTVAHVMIAEDVMTLINHREKYFIREQTNAETARRMVGIPLLSQEIAALLSGKGYVPSRYSQVFPTAGEDGGVLLDLWHMDENLRARAGIDKFGRLRWIQFADTNTEFVFLRCEYLEFRQDFATTTVVPDLIVLNLLDRGETLRLEGKSVDINNKRLLDNAGRQFVRRERGPRIRLNDIPEGAPVLYRNLKVYVEDEQQ